MGRAYTLYGGLAALSIFVVAALIGGMPKSLLVLVALGSVSLLSRSWHRSAA